jgi:predicted alpha-1,2-mannosidase
MEYAYDDFCLSQFAAALGKEKDRDQFLSRSRNYQNLFNAKTGFMQGRRSDGAWETPFDEFRWGEPYTEGNAWQYLWFVSHDPEGLARLLGGWQAFAQKLDHIFTMPPVFHVGVDGLIMHDMNEMVEEEMGQYHHGNEPMQHVPYLYAFVGQPWKTQSRVREIMRRLYRATPAGLSGDEDTGQTSAWFLFSALGFYPVCPSRPVYVLGSPLFTKALIRLANGKSFVVEASSNSPANVYIQSVELNGVSLGRSWISHDEIMKGGTLRLMMGPQPNKKWASTKESVPESLTR